MREEQLHLSDKQKKYLLFLLVMAVFGMVLLTISTDDEQKNTLNTQMEATNVVSNTEIKSEEIRLSEILSKVEGAGKVEVMIRFRQSAETVYATEYKENRTNITEDGLQRQEENNEKVIAMRNIAQGEEPLIIKTIQPEIIGVVIVAQGADKIPIKNALLEAAAVYLDVPTYKINVLTMKKG